MNRILDKLHAFLSQHFGVKYEFTKKSQYSLQFRFHNDIDVDLLPSPYWEKPEELHRFLENKTDDQRQR